MPADRPDQLYEQRFERCFVALWPRVRRFLRSRGAGELTDDLASETFAIAWRTWTAIPRDPLPWLLRTARNLHGNALRRHHRRDVGLELELGQDLDFAAQLDDRRTARRVLTAVGELPADQREALLLTVWDELSVGQAAQVCGCSAGTLRMRLHRARRSLRATLTDPTHDLSTARLGCAND